MKDNVILYHQHGCGMCKAVEIALSRKGIKYESKLITLDNIEEAQAKGITGTPTLVVGEQKFFRRECLDWINQQ